MRIIRRNGSRTPVLCVAIGFICSNLFALPTVTTYSATDVGAGVATLNATVNPNGVTTSFYFEYGLTAGYGNRTTKISLTGSTLLNMSNVLAGLQLQTPYHFRAVATNLTGNSYGTDFTFTTTDATAPTIITNFVNNPGATNATLSGSLYPNGLPATVWFEYGLTTNYDNVTIVTNLSSGTSSQTFRLAIGGLAPGTTYYFHAVATNSLGAAYGTSGTFLTAIFGEITAVAAPGLIGVYYSSACWGDYNNDGQLDFVLTGQRWTGSSYVASSQLWQNVGTGFTNTTATFGSGIPNVANSACVWGDYDNDGRLDLLIVGTGDVFSGGSGTSQILRNTGGGLANVTGSIAPGLPGVSLGAAAWGDLDNDGRLDFVIAGTSNATPNPPLTQIWHNTGSNFVNITASVAPGLPGINFGAVALGDYDNDGRLDLFLAGGALSQIWHNTGSNFVNVTASVAPGLPQISFGLSGCIAWGDYDNDGLLDFFITGKLPNNSLISQIWHNSGTNFVNVTTSVASGVPQIEGSMAWGDYDSDGKLDFAITGGNLSQIWRNTGTNFVNMTTNIAPSLPGLNLGSVTWGDFDNDGRLDLLLAGDGSSTPNSQIWRNLNPQKTNSPPTAPTGLAMTSSVKGAMLSWNAATDNETPSAGLTYNICVGNNPGGTNLVAFHSDISNGFRRVAAMGNAQKKRFFPLAGVTNGQTVYWSVQAVDTAFAGGVFATQCSMISIPKMDLVAINGSNAVLSWNPLTWGWHLQETPYPSGVWTNSSIGEINPVMVPAVNTANYYRLVNQ
jgi:FG-GAP-like repeat